MQAPVVVVGDGALGFWAALRDVFPDTIEQRCWVDKTANILDSLPPGTLGHQLIQQPGQIAAIGALPWTPLCHPAARG